MSTTKGKAWAYSGFWLGVVASISGNVAHAYVVRPDPPIGALLSAAYWPTALLIALEVLARVLWPTGRLWWLLRYGGLASVAAIAALISYTHMAGLLHAYGESGVSASLGPLSVDGLMVLCSTALLAIADNAKRRLEPEKQRPIIGEVPK